ncbi:MAG: DUF1385 domain-containing protein [Nanoarchaeota archaeon]|nr:DUF1385 domain-containing protein [Nanoarchaeota archaeon]
MKEAGGQAVIEGVMMKYGDKVNVSVRKNSRIISKKISIKKKNRLLKLFFIRGIFNLFEMLSIGFNALIWSAEQQAGKDEKITKKEIFFTMLFAVVFAILFFIVVPFYLTKLVSDSKGIIFNLIDGLIRVIIFLLYIFLISLIKDVKRVFQYHGAEHKTVNCFEAGKKLTLENVKKFTTLHERCGTSFIMVLLIISILVFSLITSDRWHYKLGLRMVLLPVIVGISYELLKLSSRFKNNIIIKWLIKPGLWIQKITTKEPDNKQIEVAIDSLGKVVK